MGGPCSDRGRWTLDAQTLCTERLCLGKRKHCPQHLGGRGDREGHSWPLWPWAKPASLPQRALLHWGPNAAGATRPALPLGFAFKLGSRPSLAREGELQLGLADQVAGRPRGLRFTLGKTRPPQNAEFWGFPKGRL